MLVGVFAVMQALAAGRLIVVTKNVEACLAVLASLALDVGVVSRFDFGSRSGA